MKLIDEWQVLGVRRIGYARVSKADGFQSLDLQREAPAGRRHRRPSQPLP